MAIAKRSVIINVVIAVLLGRELGRSFIEPGYIHSINCDGCRTPVVFI